MAIIGSEPSLRSVFQLLKLGRFNLMCSLNLEAWKINLDTVPATDLLPPSPMFCAEPPRCGAVVAAVGEGIYFGFYKTDGPGKLAYGEVIKMGWMWP